MDPYLREPRPLTLSDEIRRLLIKLCKISESDLNPTISLEQLVSVENELDTQFPDSIVALFANGDDTLQEQVGVQIEEVVDYTRRAHEVGFRKIALPLAGILTTNVATVFLNHRVKLYLELPSTTTWTEVQSTSRWSSGWRV